MPTIAVAAIAAAAILLIAVGVATSGRGSGISTRLERYASGKQEVNKAGAGTGSRNASGISPAPSVQT